MIGMDRKSFYLERWALKSLSVFGLALATLVLAACQPTPPPAQFHDVPQIDPVAAHMMAAASRTSAALDRLSRVETARTPVPDPGPLDDAPPGLDVYLAVSWIGPVAPLVAKLADAADYRFRVVGRPPSIPVVVDVTTESAQVLEILRDVGHQTGARAVVSVDVEQKVIEVRYAQ